MPLQVCRLAYELMQIGAGDAVADAFHSLDDIYYFGGQLANQRRATFVHRRDGLGEIDLNVSFHFFSVGA